MRRSRRGSSAVEFAFTAPLLVFFASVVVDYGWYLNREASLIQAVRQGTRVAARVPLADGPELTAVSSTTEALAAVGLPCASGACDITATLSSAGDLLCVVTTVELTYDPIIGLVPIPEKQRFTFTMALDDQGLLER